MQVDRLDNFTTFPEYYITCIKAHKTSLSLNNSSSNNGSSCSNDDSFCISTNSLAQPAEMFYLTEILT